MPSVLSLNKILPLATLVLGILIGIAALPTWRTVISELHQDQFSELTFRCDHAMRTHLLAKQKLSGEPSSENVAALESAEIGLIDCQDYDLMRKKLIRLGLSDNELSEMALRAIEERGQSLQEVIRVHEIRY